MTRGDNQSWLRMWRNDQTEFHQTAVNPILIRFWNGLGLKRPSRIFVPLCGKSLDLLWLARQGHQVVGVELSPLAVKAFFEENGLTPRVLRRKHFAEWVSGNITLFCGDFFGLTPKDLGQIDVVYDRAALTALSESVRKRYVVHMREIIPEECRIFLLTIEDGDGVEAAPSTETEAIDDEIEALYGPHFDIRIAHAEAATACDPDGGEGPEVSVLHKPYRLRPKLV